ncbi:non-muscle caldesmon [Pempheris klunzingeri]|uniref:non-muscle caldesmon n=1 Tax=Pempheris klunzingeri TaxID=3127111 RepID=UPI003980C962
MSNAVLRRNSSKQGLQNLMRLTAQRSIEDAEEVERERRRRARQASRQTSEESAEESTYDGSLKPCGSTSPEEDEGFSDWTQRQERRRQQRLQELNQGGDEDEDEYEEEVLINKAVPVKTPQASTSRQLQRHEQDETDRSRTEIERRKECEEEEIRAERMRRKKEREEEEDRRKAEEVMTMSSEVEKRKEVKISCTSKVFLHREPKHGNANGDATKEEVTSYMSSKTKGNSVELEEAEAILETEQCLERIRQSLQLKESQELEQLRRRQAKAEQEVEELKRRRQERRRVREEEECRREEEGQQRMAKEEEERRRMTEDIERRRVEAAERMKSLSTSSNTDTDGSPFSPRAPTHKITERTESLNRSLKKSNSLKKTKTLVLLPKIDDKMEQYAHAVETSPQSVKAALSDLPGSPEAIASKKNLFEAREAWSPTRGITCKDADGLKVGVADRITQWVKGPTDGSRPLPCRASDVKSGDVMHKKNMWEVIGDSSPSPGRQAKAAVGIKYRFVVTGHGKYEKVAVASEDGGGLTDRKSDLYHGDH